MIRKGPIVYIIDWYRRNRRWPIGTPGARVPGTVEQLIGVVTGARWEVVAALVLTALALAAACWQAAASKRDAQAATHIQSPRVAGEVEQ